MRRASHVPGRSYADAVRHGEATRWRSRGCLGKAHGAVCHRDTPAARVAQVGAPGAGGRAPLANAAGPGYCAEPMPHWLVLTLATAVGANMLAGVTTAVTIDLMRGPSEFAVAARAYELTLLPYWRCVVYPVVLSCVLFYLWPLVTYARRGWPGGPSITVRRRAVSGPFVVASSGFAGWLTSTVLFPFLTVRHFGRWSPELMSQQVLSPLVNGFLAATTIYLLVDLIFRHAVVPRVFPAGQSVDTPGTISLGVQGRLLVFLVAVAFVPLFMLFGLVRAATVRLEAGMPVAEVMGGLDRATMITFAVFLVLGIGLTLGLARTFTGPLGAIARALRRVQAGDLATTVARTSSDEVGMLEDGVNAMVAALTERERILHTFGRVVEPAVRDRLLAGDLLPGGEMRTVSVLFCDLRGFTTLAERTPAAELVATMNEFFTAVAGCAREHGGVVDKFIGDAVLAVFGLFDRDTHPGAGAAAAVRCALAMRVRVADLNVARAAAGTPALAVKIGIDTGEVVAGLIGASDRHEYTVLGDAVNVAARLEALCGEQGCDLLVSERTWGLAAPRDVGAVAEARGTLALRGRDEPIRVFAFG